MKTEMTRQESLESLANDWAKTHTNNLAVALIGYKDAILANYDKFRKDMNHTWDGDKFGVEFEYGSKYVKVVTISGGGSRSVHSFVETANGNIWRAASWKSPARNFVRGNVFDQSSYINRTAWTGVV